MPAVNRKGIVVVVSAPSGAGKSTLIHKVREADPSLEFSVSCTTRAPRAGEQEGVDYYYLTQAEFGRRVAAGAFLEHAEFAGNCYGTLLSEVEGRVSSGRDVILEIEVQGARQIRDRAQTGLLQGRVFFLFIAPPSMEVLEQRLRTRGTETEERIQRRLSAAAREMAERHWYDVTVVNDDLEVAAREFLDAINRMRLRAG